MTRRVRFAYPDDLPPVWTPRLPEFSCAANSVSLLMPYAEPYVVASVRAILDDLDPDLRSEAVEYARQEAQHHGQHRRFNTILERRYPRLGWLERQMGRVFGWLQHTRSARFNLAFAAGFETVAYTAARWTEKHLDELFVGADPTAATLFLWHLAEEVEHKTVAFDLFQALDGKRRRYALAMVTSMVLLATFSVIGTLMMMASEHRLWSPVAHWRMLRWSLSFTFELLPNVAAALLPGHHPADLSDPIFLSTWLASFDEATGTMPEWSMGVVAPR